jgi:glycogen debranching enzyme
VVTALLDAAAAFGGRLQELFCGFARSDVPIPVPYPTSCSPQAWAAAVPFELLNIALGVRADLPHKSFLLQPIMPVIGQLRIDGLRFGPHLTSINADTDGVSITGLPEEVRSGVEQLAEEVRRTPSGAPQS